MRPKDGRKFCEGRRKARRANRPQDGLPCGRAAVGSGAAGAPGGPVPGFCRGQKKRVPGSAGAIPGRDADFGRLRRPKLGLPFWRSVGAVPEKGPDLNAWVSRNSVYRFCGSLELFQKGARIFNAWVSRNSVYRFCGSLELFQKGTRIFNAWVSGNSVYRFCGLLELSQEGARIFSR